MLIFVLPNQLKPKTMNVSMKALAVINIIKKAIESSLTGVSFVSIKNYTNKQNEVSNNLINVGINYENAKAKDIETLENLNLKAHDFKSPLDLLKIAKEELILAFLAPNENRSQGQQNAYTTILPGVKVHNETGVLYVYGYRENKTVLVKGEYKHVNSAPLTIAKNELRALLRTGKFTQFALEVGNTIKASGETLEL
jgi:hypothetical protein